MTISFLLAPCRSPLARTNALQLRASKKDIRLGKVQRSLGKKRFVNRPLDWTPAKSRPRRAFCSISPSLARNELRGFLHDQCKLVFDGSNPITNTPIAGKKNVALPLDCDQHVLGIDKLQTKRQ